MKKNLQWLIRNFTTITCMKMRARRSDAYLDAVRFLDGEHLAVFLCCSYGHYNVTH